VQLDFASGDFFDLIVYENRTILSGILNFLGGLLEINSSYSLTFINFIIMLSLTFYVFSKNTTYLSN